MLGVSVKFDGNPTEVRDWVFTFGYGHVHPETGEPLHNRFVRIKASFIEARRMMFEMFGQKWSMQYTSEEEAGVEQFGLKVLLTELDAPEPHCLGGEHYD